MGTDPVVLPDVLVVCGGGPVRAAVRGAASGARVVAADGGADEALRLGLRVDLVVGDMDSVTPDALVRIEAEGGEIRRHPVDKDAIDLELALDEALAGRPERILVVGGAGGRFDFVLANALVLANRGSPTPRSTAGSAMPRSTSSGASAGSREPSGNASPCWPSAGRRAASGPRVCGGSSRVATCRRRSAWA